MFTVKSVARPSHAMIRKTAINPPLLKKPSADRSAFFINLKCIFHENFYNDNGCYNNNADGYDASKPNRNIIVHRFSSDRIALQRNGFIGHHHVDNT